MSAAIQDRRPGPVLVSLSSFGATDVRRQGQAWFTRLCVEAGADGVEVRGELLADGDAAAELDEISDAAGSVQLVYSSPEGLWSAADLLDAAALDRGLRAARRLRAPRLKMSIGAFEVRGTRSMSSIQALARTLGGSPVELVIENDQTPAAGTLDALARFFEACDATGLRLGMTFDVGNWHWTGECPLAAAAAFGPRVAYVHCKGVQRRPEKWVAVPLAESAAPWRAVLRSLGPEASVLPWAIEYPLAGDDLASITRQELGLLRHTAGSLA